MSALRLLVADDHAVVRAGMKALLEDEAGWEVVAVADNGRETEQVAQEVLNTGAKGYILKSDAGKELVAAVQNVSNHLNYLTTRVARMVPDSKLKEGMQAIDADDIGTRLTPREREIVQLLAEGRSNKEAAAVLNISVKTVETHRTNIMRKLRFHSIGELVRYAVKNHIVAA